MVVDESSFFRCPVVLCEVVVVQERSWEQKEKPSSVAGEAVRELVAGIEMVANIDRIEGALCTPPRPPVEGSFG